MKLQLIVCLSLAACFTSGSFDQGTEGQLDHATFDYGCTLFGSCGVDSHHLAASGARAHVNVTMKSGYSYTNVMSTHPEVATFTLSQGLKSVEIVTGSAGQTDLVLLDSANTIVDEVTLTVVSTASLATKQGWSGPRAQVILNSLHTFHVTTQDSSGETTIGTGAVTFQSSGTIQTTIPVFRVDDIAELLAADAGPGTATATADQATTVVDIDVLPPSAITQLVATKHATTDNANTVSYDLVMSGTDGPVYGGDCEWTMSDPSVTIYDQHGNTLEEAPITTVTFELGSAGHFTATCVMGTATTTVQLSR
jgi:hypothetical protein